MPVNAESLDALRVNPDWRSLPLFDRTGWTRVRFGDVVQNVNETVDPAEAGIERFIGLEHLEPGSLHLPSWGDVADGTTFTRRCRPGQVLFGKRRAYQRKVAVAELMLSCRATSTFLAFGGPCVHFHRECLREGEKAFLSYRHIEMLYATLASWGMHRMGGSDKAKTKLAEWEQFYRQHCPERCRSGSLSYRQHAALLSRGLLRHHRTLAADLRQPTTCGL
jgi:hypothetical protein